jgi:ABC-2 type transport system ATP-binding protein
VILPPEGEESLTPAGDHASDPAAYSRRMHPFQPAVVFHGVVKQYKTTRALDGLTVDVPKGRLTGFLGPNGAGKTTSFRAMLGLTRPSAGSIQVLGMEVGSQTAAIVKQVGAVIEEPGLHKTLSAVDNLRSAALTIGAGYGRIDELLEFVSLAEVSNRKVGQFSKGMRQRLALAQAMLADPELLILDEPLDGLDPQGQVDLKRRLRALVEERGKTVVVSSHNLTDVEELADHVIVINRGRLVTTGSVDDLIGADGRFVVEIKEFQPASVALAAAGMDVTMVDGRLVVAASDGSMIARALADAGLYPSQLMRERASLESVFLDLTREES